MAVLVASSLSGSMTIPSSSSFWFVCSAATVLSLTSFSVALSSLSTIDISIFLPLDRGHISTSNVSLSLLLLAFGSIWISSVPVLWLSCIVSCDTRRNACGSACGKSSLAFSFGHGSNRGTVTMSLTGTGTSTERWVDALLSPVILLLLPPGLTISCCGGCSSDDAT